MRHQAPGFAIGLLMIRRSGRTSSEYFADLDANAEALALIRKAIRKGPVTLLFSSHDASHNNALALKRYLTSRRK
jgi:uncharacterized protein YeaO (DUF488 family)